MEGRAGCWGDGDYTPRDVCCNAGKSVQNISVDGSKHGRDICHGADARRDCSTGDGQRGVAKACADADKGEMGESR